MLLSKVCVQAFLMPDPRLSTIFPTRPSSVTAVYLPVTALCYEHSTGVNRYSRFVTGRVPVRKRLIYGTFRRLFGSDQAIRGF
jgi:hypothetical protein